MTERLHCLLACGQAVAPGFSSGFILVGDSAREQAVAHLRFPPAYLALDEPFDHHAAMVKKTDELPKRRKRVQHFDAPGEAHFLTFSCYGRTALLGKDRTRLWLVDAIDEARGKHRFDLWAWVFMPEHVHLLIWPRQAGYKTPRILADIKRPVGQEAIGWLKRHCPGFLTRLTVRTVTARTTVSGRPGPVRIGTSTTWQRRTRSSSTSTITRSGAGVARAQDWPWSSAAEWAGKDDVLLKIDRSLPALAEWIE